MERPACQNRDGVKPLKPRLRGYFCGISFGQDNEKVQLEEEAYSIPGERAKAGGLGGLLCS